MVKDRVPEQRAEEVDWFLLLIGVSVLLVLVFRTNKEEENLMARFGDDYRSYMERTSRFFPRL